MPFEDEISADVPVSEVMTRNVVQISFEAPIWEAAQLFAAQKVGSVIVVDWEGRTIGILTERDLITRAVVQDRDLKTYPVGRIASKPVVSVTPETSTYEALKLMIAKRIRHLVVNEDGIPLGILTVSTVLRIVPDLVETLQELIRLHQNSESIRHEEGETIPSGGYCECCGEWSEPLEVMDGFLLCESCVEERK
ncbi:MAG: cyclic nucleotide-binding/CBS domain-containing protein [Candidatus Hodarchaeota archaeon]